MDRLTFTLVAARRTRGLAGACVALAALVVAVAALPAAGASAQGGSPHVLVSTTGNDSELRKTVPITRKQGKRRRVVISMGPDRLPDLSSGDRLQTSAEVEVTTDCYERMPRCVGKPYRYNPIVRASFLLANGPKVKDGEGTLEFGSQRNRCRQKPPDREHHCVVAFADMLEIPDRSQLPCAPGSCYLNLVIGADNRRKKKGKKGRPNKLLIGEDEPDGSIVQDKARINAIRHSPSFQPPITPLITPTPLLTSVPVRKGERHVVYSQRLDGLERGEQLAVAARMLTDVSGLSYAVLNKSRIILAPTPNRTGPGKDVKKITEPTGEITEANGFNCTQRRPECTTGKYGVITMTDDAREGGEPIPLYVNLVLSTAKPGAEAPSGDAVRIVPGGAMSVTRFPASLRG